MRWLVLVALAACKEPTSKRHDAAPPTASSPARLLRYQPANLPRYQVVATVTSPPGSLVPLDVTRTIALHVVAEDDRHVRARVSDRDPLAAYEVDDATQAAVLLFPALPAEPMARGERWTVPLTIRVPGSEQPIVLTHTVELRDDSLLVIDGPARNASVRTGGETWLVVYGFAGQIELDRERGVVARARLDATANVANGPANVTVNATLVAMPAPRDAN